MKRIKQPWALYCLLVNCKTLMLHSQSQVPSMAKSNRKQEAAEQHPSILLLQSGRSLLSTMIVHDNEWLQCDIPEGVHSHSKGYRSALQHSIHWSWSPSGQQRVESSRVCGNSPPLTFQIILLAVARPVCLSGFTAKGSSEQGIKWFLFVTPPPLDGNLSFAMSRRHSPSSSSAIEESLGGPRLLERTAMKNIRPSLLGMVRVMMGIVEELMEVHTSYRNRYGEGRQTIRGARNYCSFLG